MKRIFVLMSVYLGVVIFVISILYLIFQNETDFTITGLKDKYLDYQRIDFVIHFKGEASNCSYPTIKVINETGKIIWENNEVYTLCITDLNQKFIDKEWQIGNSVLGTLTLPSGKYQMIVEFEDHYITRGIIVIQTIWNNDEISDSQNADGLQLQGIDYANLLGSPITFTVTKSGFGCTDHIEAKIYEKTTRKLLWNDSVERMCHSMAASNPYNFTVFFPQISSSNIPVDHVGDYILQVLSENQTIEAEFIVRENISGISLDRSVYPIPENLYPSNPEIKKNYESNTVKIMLGKQIDDYDSGVTFHPPYVKTIIGYNNTVTWINENKTPVKLESDDGYFNMEIKPHESFSARFDKIGVYRYHSPDNWKRGTIIASTQEIESMNLKPAELLRKNPDDMAKTIASSLISQDKVVKKRLDNTMLSAYVTDEGADIMIPNLLCLLCDLNYNDAIQYRYGVTKGLTYPKDESAALDFAKNVLKKIGYITDGSEWIDKTNFGDRIQISIQQRIQGWIIPNHITRFDFYKDHTWITLGRWYDNINDYKFNQSQESAKRIAKEYMNNEVKGNPNLQKYAYQFESVSDDVRVILFNDKPVYAILVGYKASAMMHYENGHCGGSEYFGAYVMVEGKTGSVLGWFDPGCA